MNQFLKIAAIVATFSVIFLAGAVIGGVVVAQFSRVRFERFDHQRQMEQQRLQAQRQVEQAQRQLEQQRFNQMLGSLRQQLQGQQQQMQQAQRRALPAPEQFGPQLMQRFVNQIRPTPDEREKIRPLVNQAAEDLRRLRRDTTHSTEMILEHLQDQISAILNPVQRDRFSDMVQGWRDKFQQFNLEQQQRQAQQRLLEQQQQQRQSEPGPGVEAPSAGPPQAPSAPAPAAPPPASQPPGASAPVPAGG